MVERFYDALRQERPEIAWRQLSAAAVAQLESQSGQACAKVIDRLGKNGGAIVAVEVYLTNAKVDLRNDESASSFTSFILATVWFIQRGSTESKPERKQGARATSSRSAATRPSTRPRGRRPAA